MFSLLQQLNSVFNITLGNNMKSALGILLLLVLFLFGEDFTLTSVPTTALGAEDTAVVRWIGALVEGQVTPDSATLFLATTPGGGVVANYDLEVTVYTIESRDTADRGVPEKQSSFVAASQDWYAPGMYYGVLVYRGSGGDTISSAEFQVLFKHPTLPNLYAPVGVTAEVAPLFRWERYSTVPFFHLLLTDDIIVYDPDNPVEISDIHVIWDTITSDTSVLYDLSSQPPLLNETTYSWVVLNNYSGTVLTTVQDIPHNIKTFTTPTADGSFKVPQLLSPQEGSDLSSQDNATVYFRWTNLESSATAYQLRLSKSIVDGAKVEVFSQEYLAGTFSDTAQVSINALSLFSTNTYWWRVVALDSNGVGYSDTSLSFDYTTPSGTVAITTYEQVISGSDTLVTVLDNVGLTFEVLSGVFEPQSPLITGASGSASAGKPVGMYRVTTEAEGFLEQREDLEVIEGATTSHSFILVRASTNLFGSTTNSSGVVLSGVTVTALSEGGDMQYTAVSDFAGSYRISLEPGVWSLTAQKEGFTLDSARSITLLQGDNSEVNPLILAQNTFGLSGVVRDSDGGALVSSHLQLATLDQVVIGTDLTNSMGQYSFSLMAGTYLLEVSKLGFSPRVDTLHVTNSLVYDVVLSSDVAVLQGTIYGVEFNGGDTLINPLSGATLSVLLSPTDTQRVVTSINGSYTLSLPSSSTGYEIDSRLDGYIASRSHTPTPFERGMSYFLMDTLVREGRVTGDIIYEGNPVQGAYLSVIKKSSGTVAYQAYELASHFVTTPLPEGEYSIEISSDSLYVSRIIALLDSGLHDTITTVISREGRIYTTSLEAIETVQLELASGEVSFEVSATYDTNSVDISGGNTVLSGRILTPRPMALNLDDTMIHQTPGIYTLQIASASKDLLVRRSSHDFTAVDSLYNLVTPLVYSHTTPSLSASQSMLTLEIGVWESEAHPLDSAYVAYRLSNAGPFTMAPLVQMPSQLSVQIPYANSKDIEYYFILRDSAHTSFGSAEELYHIAVPQDSLRLSALQLEPTPFSTVYTLAPFSTTRFALKGYAGSDYGSVALPPSFIDSITTTSTLEVVVDNSNSHLFVSSRGVQSLCTLSVYMDSTQGVTLGTALSNPFQVLFQVSDNPLDSVRVVRIDQGKVVSGGGADFMLQGYDTQNNPLDIGGAWSVTPAQSGTVSPLGLFTPAANYFGRVGVLGTVDNSFYDLYDTNGVHGVMVYASIDAKGAYGYDNREGVVLQADSGALLTDQTTLFSLDKLDDKNLIKKTVIENKVTIISEIYRVGSSNPESINPNDSTLTLTIAVPEEYRQYLSGDPSDTSRCKIALYNEEEFFWDYPGLEWEWEEGEVLAPDSIRIPHWWYNPTEKSISVSLNSTLSQDKNRSFALVLKEGELAGTALVSPNPFSPMVSPLRQYMHLDNMTSDVKGTCIKFTPPNRNNSYDRTAVVSIYTPAGEMVWRARLGTVYPGKTYYLFWDGRTRIDRSSAQNQLVVQENSAIYTTGENLCRNGRYILNITFDDGSSKREHITQEIILFK